jgi:hypothetical protein
MAPTEMLHAEKASLQGSTSAAWHDEATRPKYVNKQPMVAGRGTVADRLSSHLRSQEGELPPVRLPKGRIKHHSRGLWRSWVDLCVDETSL